MPIGDEDEMAARCAPLLFFDEVLLCEVLPREVLPREVLLREVFSGARLFGGLFFGELLAKCAFLGCGTFIRFWSSTIVDCTCTELMSIRPCGVMHMGFAVRTQASHQVSPDVKVAGKSGKSRTEQATGAINAPVYVYPRRNTTTK